MQKLIKTLETKLPALLVMVNSPTCTLNGASWGLNKSSADNLVIEAYTGQFNVEIVADQHGLALVSQLLQTLSEQADKKTPFAWHFSGKKSDLADHVASEVYVKTELDFLVASYIFISAEHRLLNLDEEGKLPAQLEYQAVQDVENGFA